MNTPENKSPSSFGHGGNLAELASQAGCPPERLIDFSANINPLGPPEYLRQVISRNLAGVINYPDPHCLELTTALAGELGVESGQIIIANGSTELIYALARTLPCERAVIPVPSYLDYEKAARLARLQVKKVQLREADDFRLDFAELAHHLQEGDLVYLGRPNNPTGASFAAEPLQELVAAHPETFFAVDESFFAFIDGSSALVTADMPANLIVIRSLTKFYAIPGLRLGYAVASPVIAGMLRQQVLPWTVNHLAQAAGKAMVGDHEYNESSRRFVRQRRLELVAGLAELPALKVFPGEANYLLVKLQKKGLTARQLAERLLRNDPQTPIAIRVCANFSGLDESYFRVAVRDDAENTKLCLALARELGSGTAATGQVKKKTPALMLQGTSSDAGKSVLAAAFCRIFLQDGYRVAPFKAQNMSLNSFVTRNGEEMGRAQVVQAQACRLDPDVRMNPVLLKPSSDVGCQVIVNGFPIGNMRADNYIDYKGEAAAAARAAYDSLAAEHDLMVLEGAGSPAEVNLKQHDIVNMGMAHYAGAEVLLVGDIDRGGIFASFIGTMEVMAEWERQRIAGFIVNRFRGMESLLDDAFRYTEEFTAKPVLGTVPMIKDLGLPEEDSVSYKAGSFTRAAPTGEHVVIGVIDLPHISNFTDLEPFLAEPDVHLKIIRSGAELDAAADDLAALILPGSKNVISDLGVLRQNGIAARIVGLARQGNLDLVGICGGFQMLGCQINDPHRIESAGGEVEGLGLLAMTTTLAAEKTLIRQSGTYLPARLKVHGYEIHHGRTTSTLDPALQLASGAEDGAVSADGRIWGSYLHGIFDDDDFRRWFIDMLRSSRNLQPLGRVAAPYDLEPALDRLADIVRRSVDLAKIYRILGLR